MGCLYKRISETKKRSTRAREGKLDSVVQGVNTLSPNDGIDVISGACTNVVNGVIPDVRISVAPGLSPGRKTDGSSEVILAQIPSAQSNTQVTIMIPAPEGVESTRSPGSVPCLGGRGEPRPPGPEPGPGGREPRPGGREPNSETASRPGGREPRPGGREPRPGGRESHSKTPSHPAGFEPIQPGREYETYSGPSGQNNTLGQGFIKPIEIERREPRTGQWDEYSESDSQLNKEKFSRRFFQPPTPSRSIPETRTHDSGRQEPDYVSDAYDSPVQDSGPTDCEVAAYQAGVQAADRRLKLAQDKIFLLESARQERQRSPEPSYQESEDSQYSDQDRSGTSSWSSQQRDRLQNRFSGQQERRADRKDPATIWHERQARLRDELDWVMSQRPRSRSPVRAPRRVPSETRSVSVRSDTDNVRVDPSQPEKVVTDPKEDSVMDIIQRVIPAALSSDSRKHSLAEVLRNILPSFEGDIARDNVKVRSLIPPPP